MANQKQILLDALLHIQVHGPYDRDLGICYNVERATMNVPGTDDLAISNMMFDLWKKWPNFSGTLSYPVPHPQYSLPEMAYIEEDHCWEGEYGDSRKELLSFLIAELQKDSE